MTPLIAAAGPVAATLLALALATRALALAGGPNLRVPTRMLSRLILLLTLLFVVTIALHFLVAS
jgi:hypothetical protein